MARVPDLVKYCAHHDLEERITVANLIAHRHRQEKLVGAHRRSHSFPPPHGDFVAHGYRSDDRRPAARGDGDG